MTSTDNAPAPDASDPYLTGSGAHRLVRPGVQTTADCRALRVGQIAFYCTPIFKRAYACRIEVVRPFPVMARPLRGGPVLSYDPETGVQYASGGTRDFLSPTVPEGFTPIAEARDIVALRKAA